MGLFKEVWTTELTGPDGTLQHFRVKMQMRLKQETTEYTVWQNDEIILSEHRPLTTELSYKPAHFELPNGLTLSVGQVTQITAAIEFRHDDTVLYRSDKRPFRGASKLDKKAEVLEKKLDAFIDKHDEDNMSEEQAAMLARQKDLQPSIFIDIGFGILFFFVAREFGLVTAALTGAGAALVLFAIQPFVKTNLLGGFAVFGVVMSLISAGIAWGFQDDLAIKLRGTFMAILAGSFALFDAFILNGGYLGKRMAMYMEGLGKLNPKRASIALAVATFIIMGIDTPLAFILTTDQWIWYNSFFDMFISIPIVLSCMYWARDRKPN